MTTMSSPQQPWSPGRPGPSDQPAPEGYGVPLGYGSPQAPAAGQGNGGPQGYGTQQPYGAPAYGAPQHPQPTQPQPYGGGPLGELVLNLRKPFGAMGMISPVVVVDGRPVGASWGRNAWQVPAGVRQVDVAQSYLWTYGRASQPVDVAPGGTSEIFYSGPMATFGFGGAIGTEPQRRPGTSLFIGLMVFLLLLVVLVVVSVTVGNS
jgi:hypothetical protein